MEFRGPNPDGGDIFRISPERPWCPSSLLYNEYWVFPGGKAAGTWRWPSTPSSAKVKERAELYLYSTSGSSWPVIGRTLPLPLPLNGGEWSALHRDRFVGGKISLYSMNRRLGFCAGLEHLKKKKICCLCPGIEPLSLGHAARSLVTKLTELSRDRRLDTEQLAFVEQVLERQRERKKGEK